MVEKAPLIAAIGNFDGVHLGHQYLLRETIMFAKANGARAGVVVFDPHPYRFFNTDAAPFLLTAPSQREALLYTHGADEVINLSFDKALASLAPEEFVQDILKKRMGLAGAVTGADFRFGKGRAGDGAALQSLGAEAGLKIKLVDVLSDVPYTDKYGSSAVRKAIRAGNAKAVQAMLGRPWSVEGVIMEGQKLGRTLGFPTANMLLGEVIEPHHGVYAVIVNVDGHEFKGVANFGRRPTVGAPAPLLEAHLFDFDGDLYGKSVEVSFIDFIRDEEKFDGLDALKAQIKKDSATAREILA